MRNARSGSAPSSEVAARQAEWSTQSSQPALPVGAVHVWRAGLGLEIGCLHLLKRTLSADERARAARFRFARDRERFIAARGLVREILALYLDTAARRLSFGYGVHGKPFLAEPERSGLRFNVSHSLDVVLVAIAYEREVGVDIEHTHSGLEVEAIAETVLSVPEKRALNRFDGEAKRRAFLRLWTRKEAYIKADGQGVALPLQQLDVSVPTRRIAIMDELTGRWRTCARWTIRTLADGPDYAASLVVEGRNWQLARWRWPG